MQWSEQLVFTIEHVFQMWKNSAVFFPSVHIEILTSNNHHIEYHLNRSERHVLLQQLLNRFYSSSSSYSYFVVVFFSLFVLCFAPLHLFTILLIRYVWKVVENTCTMVFRYCFSWSFVVCRIIFIWLGKIMNNNNTKLSTENTKYSSQMYEIQQRKTIERANNTWKRRKIWINCVCISITYILELFVMWWYALSVTVCALMNCIMVYGNINLRLYRLY